MPHRTAMPLSPSRLAPTAFALVSALALAIATAPLAAQTATAAPPPVADSPFGQSKLLLTGGVSSIDGAAGGGLTPWALVGSYASNGQIGATAFVTRTRTQDYGLTVAGVAVGVHDRVEVSLARQAFDAGAAVPGALLRLDIVGVKVRLLGDAVLDPDRWWPQVAVGAELKHVDPGAAVGGVLDSVGAKRHDLDYYVSATKLVLGQGVLLNGTLRATRANQNGLLGFGAVDRRTYHLKPELSVAWLLQKGVAVGAEVRFKPDNLSFAGSAFHEDTWKDLFVAWAPTKQVSLTAAYVDLGNVVGHPHQGGGYVSVQLGY